MCENIALETQGTKAFLEVKEKLNTIGLELIGTQLVDDKIIYLSKEK